MAVVSLLATVAVVLLPLSPIWHGYPVRWRVVVSVGGLVALDDGVSHALGVWTPLDAMSQTGL